jgi:hypothetical protein
MDHIQCWQQCCVSSWSVDKKSVLNCWRRRANTFLIMFYVQSIVIIINTLLETYKNIILLTCILGCQVWILTCTLRILRAFMVFLNPFTNISSYYSTKISLHACLRSLFCNEPTIQGYILESELKYAVGHLVEALRYKPEGRGFDFRWCHWNFLLTQTFRQHCGPGVDSASNRNEYQEYFLGVNVAGA